MSYTPPPPPPPEGEPGDGSGATPPGYGTPPPPGYGTPPPPGYGTPPPPGQPPGTGQAYGVPKNSTKAVVALVVGLISPILGLCCAFFGLVGIVAVVLGRQAQKEIVGSGGMLTGAGMAKAGVVLGIIGAVLGVVMTILNVVLLTSGDGNFNFTTY